MTPQTIAQIYKELSGVTCFRVRDTETLQDWATGNRYDWTWDETTSLPIEVKAVMVEAEGVRVEKLNAEVPKYALLSTVDEVDYLKHFPAFGAFQLIRESYRMAEHRKNVIEQTAKRNRHYDEDAYLRKAYLDRTMKDAVAHGTPYNPMYYAYDRD